MWFGKHFLGVHPSLIGDAMHNLIGYATKTSFRECPISPFENLALCVGYQRLANIRQQAVSRQNTGCRLSVVGKNGCRLSARSATLHFRQSEKTQALQNASFLYRPLKGFSQKNRADG